MLALGFFTGMRLGTICDLRIDTLEQSIPYMILLLKALLLIPKGTPVTQNNVGKEAGSDPSALTKSRFPSLIAEIKTYVEQYAEERPLR